MEEGWSARCSAVNVDHSPSLTGDGDSYRTREVGWCEIVGCRRETRAMDSQFTNLVDGRSTFGLCHVSLESGK